MKTHVLLAIPSQAVAFSGPGFEVHEFQSLHSLFKTLYTNVRSRYFSISIYDWNLFTRIQQSLAELNQNCAGQKNFVIQKMMQHLLSNQASELQFSSVSKIELCKSSKRLGMCYSLVIESSNCNSKFLAALILYRPQPLIMFCKSSARRAVRFVNAVITLVTMNACISTLGGGHFLCKHVSQAKLMAKLQIMISVGLQDPVLESKCRINLAYNAIQTGKFKGALRIIRREMRNAENLENDEMRQVCHAAKVYCQNVYRLYMAKGKQLMESERGPMDLKGSDSYYRQRIVAR